MIQSLAKAIVAALFAAVVSTHATQAATGGPDLFGYTWKDSSAPGGPNFQWIDISTTGTRILSSAVFPEPATVATLELNPPPMFYAFPRQSVRVSRHGYISMDVTDPGTDTTNLCPFVGQNPATGGGPRYVVHHDQLIQTLGFAVFHQFFDTSPHLHHSGPVHVISWRGGRLASDPTDTQVEFQALLFLNGDILYQYKTMPPGGSGSASAGLLDVASPGISYACNNAAAFPSNHAVLFEPPTAVFSGGSFQDFLNSRPSGTKVVFDPALVQPLPGLTFGERIIVNGSNLDRSLIIDGLRFPVADGIITGPINVEPGVYAAVMGLWTSRDLSEFSSGAITVRQNGHGVFAGNKVRNGSDGGHMVRVLENGRAYVSRLLHPYNEFNKYESDVGALIHADIDSKVILADSVIQHIHSNDPQVGIIRTVGHSDITIRNTTFRNIGNIGGGGGTRTALLRGFVSLPNLTLDRVRADFDAGDGDMVFGRVNTTINRSSLDVANITLQSIVPILVPPSLKVNSTTVINSRLAAPYITIAHSYLRDLTVAPEISGSSTHSAYDRSAVSAATGDFTSLGYNIWFPLTMNLPHFTHPEDIESTIFLTARDNNGPTVVYRPVAASPLVDAGDPALTPSAAATPKTDQLGTPRVIDGSGDGTARIDIGPVEYFVTSAPVVVTTAQDDPIFGTTLRQAIDTAQYANPPRRVIFEPALSGATFQLLEANGPLRVDMGSVEVDASMLAQRPRMVGVNFLGLPFSSEMPLIEVVRGGTLVMRNFRFSGIRQVIDVDTAFLTLADCVFSDNGSANQATLAAAIIVQGQASNLTLEGCVFTRNQARNRAGAVYMNSAVGELVVRNCRFTDNNNTGSSTPVALPGSAIHVDNYLNYIEVSNTTFSGNTYYAFYMRLQNGGVSAENRIFTNCTFAHNSQAIGASDSDFIMRHCTIARHSPTAISPTIFLTGTATFSHCIFAYNWAPNTGVPLNADAAAPLVPGNSGVFLSEGYNIEDGDDFGFNGPGDRPRTDPLLAPFAHYGGDGRSFALLAESPAINGGNPALSNMPAGDVRGYPRVSDGLGNGQPVIDIGSFEARPPIVVGQLEPKSDNLPPYSLPEAVTLAEPGGRVIFERSLAGGNIPLTAPLVPGKDLMIDASSLLVGPRIGGGDATRLLEVGAGESVSCHALVLRRGFDAGDGGAIHNAGNLCLHACAVVRNESGGFGGAIYQDGGNLVLEQTTIAENTAATGGGAIADNPSRSSNLVLRGNTISHNHSVSGSGGLRLGNSNAVFAFNLVAANTNDNGLRNLGTLPATTLTSLGYNFSDNNDFGFSSAGDRVNATTGLSTIAENGGWVPTSMVAKTSDAGHLYASLTPTLDSFTPSVGPFDGRGYSRRTYGISGSPAAIFSGAYQPDGDIYDADFDGMPDWWERRYGFDILNPADANEDADGDGFTNLVEFQNGTHPRIFDGDPQQPGDFQITAVAPNGTPGSLDITFTSDIGTSYTIQYSLDLETPWTDLDTITASAAETTVTATLPVPLQSEPRAFFRVRRNP